VNCHRCPPSRIRATDCRMLARLVYYCSVYHLSLITSKASA
jgi:hypothetical protein